MTNPFERLDTPTLLRMLQSQADACVRVTQMSDTQKNVVGPKGEASPLQAGVLNAVTAMQVSRVLKSRGVVTGL